MKRQPKTPDNPSTDARHSGKNTEKDVFVVPVSFAQQRLWVLDQLAPDNSQYNIPIAQRLRGRLDREALLHGLNEIVRRHEVLRTTFAQENGLPVQVIVSSMTLEMPVLDISDQPESEREANAVQLMERESQLPFNLEQGPLLRASLFYLGEHDHILLLTIHHIISDGWSIGILNRELSALYSAHTHGQPSPLAELPIQYADYALSQRDLLQGEALEQQIDYWREQLAGVQTLDLPTDQPRPILQKYTGATKRVKISTALTEALKGLSQRHGVTLFMTMLAIFQVLLHRYSQQEDIAVGSPIAGRNRPEVEGLIGFFVNTLVLRTDLSADPTFIELLGRVRKICLDAYANQDLPFEKLVEKLKPKRELSRNPLFQSAFVLDNTPVSNIQMPDLETSIIPLSQDTAKFDLTLSLSEDSDGGISGTLNYNTDLFFASTIERIIDSFRILIEGLIHNPNQHISELPLQIEKEYQYSLAKWNDTETPYPRDQCIHQLFETQAALSPDAIALQLDERQISYMQLNAQANQLACYLRKLGIGPESRVCIALPRSIEMVIGIIGILKAGGAYVPLDPAYPQERLAFMLQDTDAPVLMTSESLLHRFSMFKGQNVCLDRDKSIIARETQENLSHETSAENLAYIIYTSGSTGIPKGVEIPHRGVLRLVCNVDYVRLNNKQRHLLLAPISFDASTFELWGALLHGAICCIYPEELLTIQCLESVIQKNGITSLWLTSSLFNMIIDEAPNILHSLEQLLTGGEALSVKHVRRALEYLPNTKLINGYGPTESTTFTCCYSIPRELDDQLKSIPIGRPIANTQVYILDQNMKPVQIGIPGELYIGGDGLARGYRNRPELTMEKFVCNPFSDNPESRLYKTGDRARYHPDGNIEFIGRLDHQVKIRGFRIEPGEIEAVISKHPEVSKSTLAVHETSFGEKCLVAYVVTSGQPLTEDALKKYLNNYLPGYMIPSAFIFMDNLPLTPNGKIDHKMLPAPAWAEATDRNSSYAEPRSDKEIALTAIWSELLKLNKVSIHDNFFALGGHSLLATQVISRINMTFDLEIPLRTLFESPTIAELSNVIETSRSISVDKPIIEIKPVARVTLHSSESTSDNTANDNLSRANNLRSRDKLEPRLVNIWESVLGVKPIGLQDNFFELGGHSLLGVKLLYEIDKAFGKQLPLAALFEYPTISKLAGYIYDQESTTYKKTIVPIKTTGSRPPFFCIHGRAEALARYLDPEQPFYWLHHSQEGGKTPYLTVEEIASIHVRDIREIQPHGPYYLGGFSFGGMLAYEVARQLNQREEKVSLLALFDPSVPNVSKKVKQKTVMKNALHSSGQIDLKLFITKVFRFIKRKVKGKIDMTNNIHKKFMIKYYLSGSKPLPFDLNITHMVDLFSRAAHEYEYDVSNSYIAVFSPEGRHDAEHRIELLREQWQCIAKAGLDINLVHGAIRHHQIVEEPYVQNLVSNLNRCLEERQHIRHEGIGA